MNLWAIDPGPVESALLCYDTDTNRPTWWAKLPNRKALGHLELARGIRQTDQLAIEMIASYGMAVGKEVFETCVWIGRFTERWVHGTIHDEPLRVYRRDVKLHLCSSVKAKDANVRQALLDIYGPGKELAVGRKASPGPLYGMSGDCWAALGVAVTAAATLEAK